MTLSGIQDTYETDIAKLDLEEWPGLDGQRPPRKSKSVFRKDSEAMLWCGRLL
jgi:hypothetical protein